MTYFRTLCFAVCCMVLPCLEGCVVVIPTIPLNAPGYGHTYLVVDQHDRPIKDGFLTLESSYHGQDEMFRTYPIKDGRVEVPMKIGTRCSAMYWMYVPVRSIHFENPYGTYVYPVAAGYVYEGGWQVASWLSLEFMDGLSSPPKILRMREAAPDTEREDLEGLSYPAQICNQPKDDQAARNSLHAYVEKRLAELPPSKISRLDAAIGHKDLAEVRRLLDAGADPDFQHLHSLWRPIYLAAMSGDVDIVRLLIERGAQVNILDAMGRSPLVFAKGKEVRNLLLLHGADPKHGDQPATQPATQPCNE